ncbi:phosphomannomutase/phosphoglucomutase, partial [Acinetobacter baumannii]
VVGRDGRLSGPALVDGLVAGLRRAGRNVIDIGVAPTPVVYFAAYHLRAGSCVAVTGSHNPPDYNGFKVVVGGETLSGDTIVDLYER